VPASPGHAAAAHIEEVVEPDVVLEAVSELVVDVVEPVVDSVADPVVEAPSPHVPPLQDRPAQQSSL
jgi:hypothetical protein